MMLCFRTTATSLLTALLLAGCNRGPAPLRAPGINGNAGAAALESYDGNHDGALSGPELDKVPAIKTNFKRADADGDGKVTPDEIDARIAAWHKSGLAVTKIFATVRQNKLPLEGAHITMVPESFLGPNVKSASGTTNAQGITFLAISAKPEEAGMHLGYYRIEVSKKRPDGTEAIPERYNKNTELGAEITAEDNSAERITIDLTTK